MSEELKQQARELAKTLLSNYAVRFADPQEYESEKFTPQDRIDQAIEGVAKVMAEFASQVCEQREKDCCGDAHGEYAALSSFVESLGLVKERSGNTEIWRNARAEAAELALQNAHHKYQSHMDDCLIANRAYDEDIDKLKAALQAKEQECEQLQTFHRNLTRDATETITALEAKLEAKEQELVEMTKIKERMQHERDEAHDLAESVRYQESKLKELFTLCQASGPESSIAQLHEHFAGDKRLSDTIHSLKSELAQSRQPLLQLGRECAVAISGDPDDATDIGEDTELAVRAVNAALKIGQEARQQAIALINAVLQRKAVSRDRALEEGRIGVADCRQSDVETCEEIIRSLTSPPALTKSFSEELRDFKPEPDFSLDSDQKRKKVAPALTKETK